MLQEQESMEWEKKAEDILEHIAVPPMMAQFVRLDAERRALQKGLVTVTAAIAQATEKGYGRVFGPEATEVVRRMGRGEDVGLPDAFFEDDDAELFKIELCPAKYGACTAEKREMMLAVLVPLREKLRQLNATRIIIEKARTPLMSHHVFRVAIIGCPNCCMSPYFNDFGIICQLQPAVKEEGCTQCQACVRYCTEGAITLQAGSPVIDYARCIMCGGCEKECKKEVIFTKEKSYKVVAGGTGSRHPRIARTVAEQTDAAGVIGILEKALKVYQQYPVDKKELSFHEMIHKVGVEVLA
jgi:Pyruvate/2-oxoacid:ferredoxin oxidoreductase delta subunit